jgi:drug/metabolite transporter (DMT)-like permease
MCKLAISHLWIHWAALLSGVFITAFSQVLLKKGVGGKKTFITSLINARTVTGYALFGVVTILNVYAMQTIELKTVSAFVGSSYVLVPVFARIFLGEQIDLPRTAGGVLIISGIVVFSL